MVNWLLGKMAQCKLCCDYDHCSAVMLERELTFKKNIPNCREEHSHGQQVLSVTLSPVQIQVTDPSLQGHCKGSMGGRGQGALIPH